MGAHLGEEFRISSYALSGIEVALVRADPVSGCEGSKCVHDGEPVLTFSTSCYLIDFIVGISGVSSGLGLRGSDPGMDSNSISDRRPNRQGSNGAARVRETAWQVHPDGASSVPNQRPLIAHARQLTHGTRRHEPSRHGKCFKTLD